MYAEVPRFKGGYRYLVFVVHQPLQVRRAVLPYLLLKDESVVMLVWLGKLGEEIETLTL